MLNREDGSDGLCGSFPLSDPMRSGWVTISDLARCEGATKTTILRRVGRLVAKSKLETRTGANRAKELKLDQYEGLRIALRSDANSIDEISRLAVRGEISSLQLKAVRRYRLIWRARHA